MPDKNFVVHEDNHSLGEHFLRCSGKIERPEGATFLFEYGVYPIDDDEIFCADVRQVGASALSTEEMQSLLVEAGVWSEGHIRYLKDRLGHLQGIDILP